MLNDLSQNIKIYIYFLIPADFPDRNVNFSYKIQWSTLFFHNLHYHLNAACIS